MDYAASKYNIENSLSSSCNSEKKQKFLLFIKIFSHNGLQAIFCVYSNDLGKKCSEMLIISLLTAV